MDCYEFEVPSMETPFGHKNLTCLDKSTPLLIRNDTVDFAEQGWDDYEQGFEVGSTYWMGNYLLSTLTMRREYTMRVDMWADDSTYRYAEFEQFAVYPDKFTYRLASGTHTNRGRGGNGRLPTDSVGMDFVTPDVTTDNNCGANHDAGWWFASPLTCGSSLLTGNYSSMTWVTDDSWINDGNKLKAVIMRLMHDTANCKP